MAKGYPDFFGFSMFPYYGTLYNESGSVRVAKQDSETPVDIQAKGILRGGYFRLRPENTLTLFTIQISIDLQTINTISYDDLDPYFETWQQNIPFKITRLSYENEEMVIQIRDGLSFDNRFIAAFGNAHLLDYLDVDYEVYYNLINT